MVSWEVESDDRLLAAAPGDASAFAAFYRRYEGPMLAFFFRRTADPELSADLTAEVFAAALGACRRYRPRIAPAHAWLFGIAQHKLASSRRRGRVEDRARRRLRMSPIELGDEDLERIEERVGARSGVIELLERLPADQREAVRARILEERPYDAIARELSCSTAVVRKRVSRGLEGLRDQIREGS